MTLISYRFLLCFYFDPLCSYVKYHPQSVLISGAPLSGPGQNLCVNSTATFKENISFINCNLKKPTKWGLCVYILSDFASSCIYSFIAYYATQNFLSQAELYYKSIKIYWKIYLWTSYITFSRKDFMQVLHWQ